MNDYTYAILVQTHNKLEQFLIENQEFDESQKEIDKKALEEKNNKEKNISDTKRQRKKKSEENNKN